MLKKNTIVLILNAITHVFQEVSWSLHLSELPHRDHSLAMVPRSLSHKPRSSLCVHPPRNTGEPGSSCTLASKVPYRKAGKYPKGSDRRILELQCGMPGLLQSCWPLSPTRQVSIELLQFVCSTDRFSNHTAKLQSPSVKQTGHRLIQSPSLCSTIHFEELCRVGVAEKEF